MKKEKALVIVESPAKSRTIGNFLGQEYRLMATMGHIRDLPEESLGVDVKKAFQPAYKIIPGKEKVVQAIKKAAKEVSEIYLATDEDREGEAIAWHTTAVLKKAPEEVKRVTFHEITSEAVQKSFQSPRAINLNLVNAQQARRILDRLVGYTLSPILAKRLRKPLSAGRVQSATLRILVDREREITAFQPVKYYVIEVELVKTNGETIPATLTGQNNKKFPKPGIKEKTEAEKILDFLQRNPITVLSVDRTEKQSTPPPPFTTSTLQQEAGRRFNFSASRTMSLAQQLYEGISLGTNEIVGLITYHRTDSVTIAKRAQQEAAQYIQEKFGKDYQPQKPPIYRTKSKLVQEAHEAIRPTSVHRTPAEMAVYLSEGQQKIYQLVWERFVASQMVPAVIEQTRARAGCGPYFFDLEGRSLKFDGYLRVLGKEKELFLPALAKREELSLQKAQVIEKETEPPPRYTEASLIKVMEKMGIGRPSTYAPTIETILNRNYVIKEERTLFPTALGVLVNDILLNHFPEIINLNFTARMEEKLDLIAAGKESWQNVLTEFYQPFVASVEKAQTDIFSQALVAKEKCPSCGGQLILKHSRFGAFWGCEHYPECDYTKNLVEKPRKSEKKGVVTDPVNEKCPQCGADLTVRRSRFGIFLGCTNYPKCTYTKPLRKKKRQ